jgi:hypothetical protein
MKGNPIIIERKYSHFSSETKDKSADDRAAVWKKLEERTKLGPSFCPNDESIVNTTEI